HSCVCDEGGRKEPPDRVAGQAEVVLHGDLGGVLGLGGRAAHHLRERPRRHRAGRADLALATHFRPADGRVLFVQGPDRAGSEEEPDDAVVAGLGNVADVVVKDGGDDAGGAVGGGGDDAPARRVLLVDGQGEEVHPVHDRERIAGGGLLALDEPVVHVGGAAL